MTLDTVTQSGTYTVTAIDICGTTVTSGSTTILINESPVIDTVSVTHITTTGGTDGAITTSVTGGTAPYVYVWSDSLNSITADLSDLAFGTYIVTVTDANMCTSSISVYVDELTGISEANIGSFSIHPNPNNGRFVVELSGLYNREYTFEIRNILGQTVYAETFNGLAVSSVDLNIPEGNKGVYFVTISNVDGKRTEKLIVR